jgi:outer membrane protein assembly factor BamB
MDIVSILAALMLAATSVTITEPIDGETYDGDWLMLRAIVENENAVPDSVHYILNGQPSVTVSRLNTDWYTYMADDLHTGFSESPAPMDSTIFWTAPVTGTYHEFPTPVVVDGVVYYPQDSTGDSLYALNAATGEVIWSYWTGYTDDAVTVKDGLLYTSSDSLWCLNAITGQRVWANGEATSAATTPAVDDSFVYNCNPSYSGSPTTDVYCLDRYTGALEWTVTVPGYAASCLTVYGGMLMMPTWYGPLYALDVDDGSIVWENVDSGTGYWDSSPVIVDGMIYILGEDSWARAIDPVSGNTEWETSITPGMYLSATVAYYDGGLFFGDQQDSYHRLDASDGSIVWSVPGVEHGSSGIADGVVFYGEGSNYYDETARVFALDASDGSVIWSYDTNTGPYGIVSSPSITDGVMYIAGTDGNLYAFGTGLKYTYRETDFFADVGPNELIMTSFDAGIPVAADTINFTVTQQGIVIDPQNRLQLEAYPNPFHSTASISFNLDQPSMTTVGIFDLSGRLVRTIENGQLGSGHHTFGWDGRDAAGNILSPGIYVCRIQAGEVSETTGLCLLR